MIIHVVQPGDTVYKIAREHHVPESMIIEQNELTTPSRLTPGQTIVVQIPKETYTVQPGDTLGDIAVRFGTTVYKIWQNNPQLGGKDRIYPGQTLYLSYAGEKLGSLAVNGYAYPNINRDILRKTLPYLTYLSIFSWGFRPDGTLIDQNDRDIIAMAREFGVQPIMVLTTIDDNGQFSSEKAASLLRTPQTRDTLVRNLTQELKSRGYYGVDVDFEYIPPEYAQGYADFINDLRAQLNAGSLQVFTSLAPKTSANQKGLLYEAHDYEALGAAANDALLMTYEWGYAFSEPMAVAPINKVEQVVKFATSVVPPEKLFLGIPNYGYDWTLPYTPGSRARSIGNVEAVQQAIDVGAFIAYDQLAQSPFYNYWREKNEHEVWFEDARSIRAKLELANRYRLGGVSIWNLMKYFPQLWLVLNGLFDIKKL